MESPAIAGPPRGILVRGLRKAFGAKPVLRGIDLAVAPGERLALFGPNGAGKTTLIRILATLARPASGTVCVAGCTLGPESAALRRHIGVVTHQTYLYDELTATENLRFYGRLYDVPDLEARIAYLLGRVGLAGQARGLVRTFSRGMQQRLALARALLHRPSVLLLDEPDTGLDQQAFGVLAALVAGDRGSYGGSGGERPSVVLTTHSLERGWALADRVAILARGRIVFSALKESLDVAELAAAYRRHTSTAA